ncbi:hypothetical protein BC940DRAFT_307623 [Gongronella butleri]|nr:hypothetical protein BC940DRAFT_307623 [Gongronella butleri]
MTTRIMDLTVLIEVQALRKVVAEKEKDNDIKGAIPYLAKVAQIFDKQQPSGGSGNKGQPDDDMVRRMTLVLAQADAHYQLGRAYQQTGQYIQAEATLTLTARLLEKVSRAGYLTTADAQQQLLATYDLLIDCYQVMGKPHLERGMMDRKSKQIIRMSSTTTAAMPSISTVAGKQCALAPCIKLKGWHLAPVSPPYSRLPPFFFFLIDRQSSKQA